MRCNFRSTSLLCSSAAGLIPALFIARKTDCQAPAASAVDSTQIHDVAMYLTAQSKSDLKTSLKNMGIEGDVDTSRVVVRRSCTKDDSYYYEPLFGERAAFRLKGLIRTDNGAVVVSKTDESNSVLKH